MTETKGLYSTLAGVLATTTPILLGRVTLHGLYLSLTLDSPAAIGSAAQASVEVFMGVRLGGASSAELPVVNTLGLLQLKVPAAQNSVAANQFFPLGVELESDRLLQFYVSNSAANTVTSGFAIFYFDR